MKANKTVPALGALAVVALLATGPAQACMGGGMPFFSSSGSGSCASAQAAPAPAPQSCSQGRVDAQSCGLINPELVAAVGEMAAGGMRIATHMARVLAEEVSRYAAAGDDMNFK